MMAELIDRRALKAEVRETLRDAQVSPKAITALYLTLILAMNLVDSLTGAGVLATFVSILVTLLAAVLEAGFVFYCMAARRSERSELLTLFDGFSFASKIIGLSLLRYLLVYLWSMLFVIPGVIAAYRYRFALYNLCEDPELGILDALSMSKRQTMGYKGQLLFLDLSYLGWTLLAGIPSIIYSIAAYQLLFQDIAALYGLVFQPAAWTVLVNLLPVWGWTLLMGLWQMAVAVFYLPAFQCVDLGYFETAKSTSGVGSGAAPNQNSYWDRRNGPDDLGGY